jgi:uncharacterized phage protein (TIGR02218 family)
MSGITEGELTSVALCWRLERSDGAGLGLTSHDRSVVREGVTYHPSPGIVPASVSRSLGLDAHSGEIAGVLSSDALDERALALGQWDAATIKLFAMDWTDSETASINLISGDLGEVSMDGDGFSAELRGASAALAGPVCPSTSPLCRAELGDKDCRVDLAGRSMRTEVAASAAGELTLTDAVDDRFLLGRLRYLSGANCGRATTIIAVSGSVVRVRDLPRASIEPGCRIEVREGCDKRLQTCTDRFANAVNFRGEPHLPGADLLTRYPGA